MGLHQNGFRDNCGLFRFAGAGLSNGAYPSTLPINTHLTGAQRNLTAGEGITDDKVGIPLGYLAGGSWVMPQKAGNMSARSTADFAVTATGNGVMGLPGTGSASITFIVPDATGGLIASGSGSAAMTFTVADALLTASIGGTGSASMTFSVAPALLGALASGSGSAAFSITAAPATIFPIDDTSPLRTGSATITFSGSLIPYAIGHMSGSTVDSGVLTVDAIAAGVLAAALTTPIYADIRRVNSVTVTGDGQIGSEWGP